MSPSHPLLYMRGVHTSQLICVVYFIYHGEVNIYQEDLDSFLNLAQELQLKGLNESELEKRDAEQNSNNAKQAIMKNRPKQYFSEKQETENTVERNSWEETQPVNYKTAALSSKHSLELFDFYAKTQTDIEELDKTINSTIDILGQFGS